MITWRRIAPFVGALLFGVSAWVLTREFHQVGFRVFASSLTTIPRSSLALAVLLTMLNYLVLTWHDRLAFRYAGVRLSPAQIGLASFVGYAISNNVGFAIVSGSSARYRFYSRWGLTPGDLSRVVLFYSTTFWLGLGLLAGACLAFAPPAAIATAVPRIASASAGALALLAVCGYVAMCLTRRAPIRVGGMSVSVPGPALLAAQLGVSILDWLLAASVLYVLLPEPRPLFLTLAGAVAIAQFAGLGSHVPGGLGVFEGLIVLFLSRDVQPGAVVPALIVYRVVYYLLPLAAALAVLLLDEIGQRRAHLTEWSRTCRAVAAWAVPPMLAIFTFLGGAVLLLSGATPAVPERLAWLAGVVPLPLVEASHFAGSLTGLVLLLLAQGIANRVDAAYFVATAALAVGSAASLLKGGDYEESILLALVLAALVAGRRYFTRRARAFERPLSPAWLIAVGTAVATSVWLGLFAYQHVAYRSDLWWQFAFDAEAPRFLRASVAVTIIALGVSVRRLLHPVRPPRSSLSPLDLPDVDRAIARQPRATPLLVYLGDKSILWNADRSAFLMYAARGGSCVALGDPVGPSDSAPGLIRQFIALCHGFALTPVFYEASRDHVADFADYGLTVLKIGEEARIALETFSLAGGRHKVLRSAINRIQREGYTFRVVEAAAVPGLLAQLREVSDEWLAAKNASEKGFSLGFFDDHYLSRFPVAVVERNGRVEAFANLWLGPERIEISLDLMRYRATAPSGMMDALFAHTILWGQSQQYAWFNLGMAPLAGLLSSPATRAWTRLGRFVYRHGEAVYNFQGLRAYKDKFDPIWSPRYLAYPGGIALPRVLADVTTLIGGGYARILRGGGRRVA